MERELINKIIAIVKISELKRDIKDQEKKVEYLERKYKDLRDKWRESSENERTELSKKMNGAHLGLCSADEKLCGLKLELYKIIREYPDLEDLLY